MMVPRHIARLNRWLADRVDYRANTSACEQGASMLLCPVAHHALQQYLVRAMTCCDCMGARIGRPSYAPTDTRRHHQRFSSSAKKGKAGGAASSAKGSSAAEPKKPMRTR